MVLFVNRCLLELPLLVAARGLGHEGPVGLDRDGLVGAVGGSVSGPGLVPAAVAHLVSADSCSADLDTDARVQDEEEDEGDDVHDHQVHPVDVELHVDLS